MNLKKHGILMTAAIVVMVMTLVIVITANSKTTIDLDPYLTIEASGYDGYGRVQFSVDWDGLKETYGSQLSYTKTAKKEHGELAMLMSPFEFFRECISVSPEENHQLCNGTQVAYTWNIADEMSAFLNCKVSYTDGYYTISGLTEVGTFDAFADLTVEFYGTAPGGMVRLDYQGTQLKSYDFACNKISGLRNGDIITVTINESAMDSCAEAIGEIPDTLKKAYTVAGLESYVSVVEEIDRESFQTMKTQGNDVFRAYAAKNWDASASLAALDYIGYYFLTAKNEEMWGGFNQLYLVYKAQSRTTYTNGDEKFDQINPIYWYIRYDDLIVSEDGTIKNNLIYYSIPGAIFEVDSGILKNYFLTMSWQYQGYQTLEALYRNAVEKNLDFYNHEDKVDESAVVDITVEDIT